MAAAAKTREYTEDSIGMLFDKILIGRQVMSRIELLGTVDDQHRLNIIVPDQVKAGPVKVILETVDDAPDDWFQGVAGIWAREYDPREDIYTLQDGEPFDETR